MTSTISDRPGIDDESYCCTEQLRKLLLGGDWEVSLRVRDAVIAVGDRPSSAAPVLTPEPDVGDQLLRHIVADLGGSAREIASTRALLGALFEWAAIFAPRLLRLLPEHFISVMGAIERSGNGSPEQRELLAGVDGVTSTGVRLRTEGAPGSDIPGQQARAEWQLDGSFLFSTLVEGAYTWMGRGHDTAEPTTAVVSARLIGRGGVDEGVFEFAFQLRDSGGALIPGARVSAMPLRAGALRESSRIDCAGVRLSPDALLSGECAHLEADGRLQCALSLREREDRAFAQSRVAGFCRASSSAVAAARGGLTLVWEYARRTCTADGVLLAEGDAVRAGLVSAIARTFAMTALSHAVRERMSANPNSPTTAVLASMATAALTRAAREVLLRCRELAGTEGFYRVNHLADWIESVDHLAAECDLRGMEIGAGHRMITWCAGRAVHDRLTAVDSDAVLQWWHRMLADREHTMLDDAWHGDLAGTTATGDDGAAIAISRAVQDRMASEALATVVQSMSDPATRAIAADVAMVFALECIDRDSGWYSARARMTPDLAITIKQGLVSRYATLAAYIPALLSAFAIPVAALDAPMAADVLAWWHQYEAGGSEPRDVTESEDDQ